MNNLKLEYSFFFIFMALAAILLFLVFRPYLISLVVAATFAVVFQPIYNFFVRIVRLRGLAALGTVLVTVILVLIPLVIFGRQVSQEAYSLYQSLSSDSLSYSGLLLGLEEKINGLLPEFSVDLRSYASQAVSFFVGNFGSFFAGTINIFVNLLVGLFAYYYFLKDGKHFKDALIGLSPLPDKYDQIILKRLDVTINSVIKGTVIIALIQGFVAGIGLTIFGVPNPALWASMAAIAALVPGAGTALVMVPAVIFLFLTGQDTNAISLLVWAALAVGLIDNFLGPKIMERGIKIHPLFILISVLGGIAFFGPFGFLLGPLTVAVFFALFDIYQLIFNLSPNYDNK
jgi:predicted PurR-regulated permease PerM